MSYSVLLSVLYYVQDFVYPENVAYPVGGPGSLTTAIIQMHYDNPGLNASELRVLGHLAVRGRAALLTVLSRKLKQLQGCNKDLGRGLCLYSMQQQTQGSSSNM